MFDLVPSCNIKVHRLPDCTLQTKPGIYKIIVQCSLLSTFTTCSQEYTPCHSRNLYLYFHKWDKVGGNLSLYQNFFSLCSSPCPFFFPRCISISAGKWKSLHTSIYAQFSIFTTMLFAFTNTVQSIWEKNKKQGVNPVSTL